MNAITIFKMTDALPAADHFTAKIRNFGRTEDSISKITIHVTLNTYQPIANVREIIVIYVDQDTIGYERFWDKIKEAPAENVIVVPMCYKKTAWGSKYTHDSEKERRIISATEERNKGYKIISISGRPFHASAESVISAIKGNMRCERKCPMPSPAGFRWDPKPMVGESKLKKEPVAKAKTTCESPMKTVKLYKEKGNKLFVIVIEGTDIESANVKSVRKFVEEE